VNVPARRCACKHTDAYECARIRYGAANDEVWGLDTGEECECCCHEEFNDWRDDEDAEP
jgi:hypothetical protein